MPNPVMHFELIAKNPDRLKDFYRRLFGWRQEEFPGMGYALLHADAGKGIGGGLGSPEGGLPPGLAVYVEVDDVEKALASARELGAAKVLQEPSDVPGIGRFAVFTDPEGNRIGLWKLP
jgi:uncharacterized protein